MKILLFMGRPTLLPAALVAVMVVAHGVQTGSRASGGEAPHGIETRVPWTTSRVVGSPEPPPPYVTRRSFPKLTLNGPVHLKRGPGRRLYLVERAGRIVTFPDDQDVAEVDVFLEHGYSESYAITFHPGFEENRYAFLFTNQRMTLPDGSTAFNRIIRVEVSHEDPPVVVPDSEHLVLEYKSNGHNGGDLQFGPDGLLYITSGDGTSDSDGWVTGQDVSDLPSGMIRIDVDRPDPGLAYGIPGDNPFIGMENARAELWAFGFRNPWRFSIDAETGDIYVGDVGQDLWEMIWLVRRGGNYGWSVMEGGHDFYPLRKRGPTPILPPLVAHHHTESRCITGGHVYRGERLAKLVGAYLYGDHDTGKIWGLRHDGGKVTWHEELTDTTLRPCSFEIGFDGSFYMLDHNAAKIHELVPAPPRQSTPPFPRRLAETGLFTSTADLRPSPGVIPYSVNVQRWMDGATAERLLALPAEDRIDFRESGPWDLPDGAVLVKTISLEMETGRADSRKRIETQIMTRHEGEWNGYTYLWNDAQTDAVLVPAGGLDREYTIADAGAPGGERTHTWRVSGRTECMVCHARAAGWVLGVRTAQMNRTRRYGEILDNQLRTLAHIGLFKNAVEKSPADFARLENPYDETADVDRRARSYLATNCSVCHVGAGGGNAAIQLGFQTKLADTKLVGHRPLHADFGIPGAMLVAPGDPARSVLYQRVSRRGHGQMPPLGTTRVDRRWVELVRRWIEQLDLPEGMDEVVAETQGASGVLSRWHASVLLEADSIDALVARFATRPPDTAVAPDATKSPDTTPPPESAWRPTIGRGVESRVTVSSNAASSDVKESGGTWLAWTDVILPERTAARFLGSSTGLLRVWVNGDEIYSRERAGPFELNSDRFDAFLQKGFNRILVQVGTSGNTAEFHLGFRRKSADPVHEKLVETALTHSGEAARGRAVFFGAEKGQCSKCHKIGNEGTNVGPDLTGIGTRFSRVSMVESILEPSRVVAPEYKLVTLILRDGRIINGIRVAETTDSLTFGGDQGLLQVVSKADVVQETAQPLSLMPEDLEKGMTEEEFVDLIAFLAATR